MSVTDSNFWPQGIPVMINPATQTPVVGDLAGRIQSNGLVLLDYAMVPSIDSSRSVAYGIIQTLRANQLAAGGALNYRHLDLLASPLRKLIRSGAWAKLIELWVPVGNDLSAALVKLKYPVGGSVSLSADNAPTYSEVSGVTGNGTTQRLRTTLNPSLAVASQTEHGMAVFSCSTSFSGTLGGTLSSTGTFVAVAAGSSAIGGVEVFPPDGTRASQALGMKAVQLTGGAAQWWFSGFLEATTAAPSPAVTNDTLTLLSTKSAFYCGATIAGYAYFNSLTQPQMQALSEFFDAVNVALGRAVYANQTINAGDSIALGTIGATETTRYGYLFAGAIMGSENNQGINGSWLSTGGPNSLSAQKVSRILSKRPAMLIIEPSINDLLFGATPNAVAAALEDVVLSSSQGGVPSANMIVCAPTTPDANYAQGTFAAGTYPALRAQYATLASGVASKYGCRFVDFSTGPMIGGNGLGITSLLFDHLHPNGAGNALMYQMLLSAM